MMLWLLAQVAIVNVTVVDATGAPAKAAQTIVVRGSRIEALGAKATTVVPKGYRVVDGSNRFAIPGLWDNHAHLVPFMERSFPMLLANGVTTVRDVGGPLEALSSLRARVRTGSLMGPRLFLAGPILDAPFMVPRPNAMRVGIGTPEVAVRVVDSLISLGADLIKVHSFTPRGAYFAVAKRANELNIPFVGHVPDSVSVFEAIHAGQRTIEHTWMLPQAMSARGPELNARMLAQIATLRDTARSPGLMPLVQVRIDADDSASALLDGAKATALGRALRAGKTWVDPTIIVLKVLSQSNDKSVPLPTEVKYVPRDAEMRDGPPPNPRATAADVRRERAWFDRQLNVVRELHRAGAPLITGTDTPVYPLVPGFSLQNELVLLGQAGLSPMEVLQAATRNSAQAMGAADSLGTLEVGKVADIVLLRRNPLLTPKNLRSVASVVSAGKYVSRTSLDRMLGNIERIARGSRRGPPARSTS